MSFIVTTSWDDGHVLDLRLAEILNRYGLRGTFYIARDFLKDRLSISQIRELAKAHEIGAHTLSHPILTEISLEQAKAEIEGSKHWLEDLLGKKVTAFCYPRGQHNLALQKLVADASFRLARTVENARVDLGDNRFAMPTTMQIYPYPLRPMPQFPLWRGWSARIVPLYQAWQKRQGISLLQLLHWSSYQRAWIENAQNSQGIWHLWGHSWEIEDYQLWQRLENIFQILQDYPHQAKTNSELIPND